jgi:glucoamylase
MTDQSTNAPGWPGIPPRWTSSAKVGIGTSLSRVSHVWFTLSHGILNEIYYPRVDEACTRDMGLIVTDGKSFFSEEKRSTTQEVAYMAPGVPAYRLTNTCTQGRYRIEKEIITDPDSDAVLQRTRFVPLQGKLEDYHLYVLLSPHLGNRGYGNTGWSGDYKGTAMLFAQQDNVALALSSTAGWLNRSVGFVGTSDGWQDLMRHKQMAWIYERAENGNIALTGEIDLAGCGGEFTLCLGFGSNPAEAGHRAEASLQKGFEPALQAYLRDWRAWQPSLLPLEGQNARQTDLYHTSMAVLRVVESKRFPGGIIASLSIPWGFAKGDDDLGGYHLVWPRDLAETAGGFLAAGAHADVQRVLEYLRATQEGDGHWPQNMWMDGSPYWNGIQIDETAFPILLVDMARREKLLRGEALSDYWPMVRRAATYVIQNGPVTQQDRWEEDPGFSPFTLAVEIAALLAAADLAVLHGEPQAADYLRSSADAWNEGIERWTYATGTDLARQTGVEGYYVRISPPEVADAASPAGGFVPIKNRPLGDSKMPATQIVSPDALALVRFGLRAPDDPRILNTIKVIDHLLKVETPYGPVWHRYNDDGYGEHADGSAFDGTGIGRAWPLLTGERAHYELAAGHLKEAQRLAETLAGFSNPGGMIPEQVWDADPIPGRELSIGKPSGSAMPLVWAHAEYVKLLRSLRDKRVFDMPPQTVERYIKKKTVSPYASWRFNHRCRSIPVGKILRVALLAPASVHWSLDGWKTVQDTQTTDTDLGVYLADLPTDKLKSGESVVFTFHWQANGRWEGSDYPVEIEGS